MARVDCAQLVRTTTHSDLLPHKRGELGELTARESVPMNIARLEYKWAVLVAATVGILTVSLDEGTVRIILPHLSNEYGVQEDDVVWVWLIAMLVSAGLVLTVGRIGDALGRKRVYVLGLTLFTVGLGGAAAAPGLPALIVVRGLQAVGSAMTLSMVMAIVTAASPPAERGRALGIMGIFISLGLLSGPAAGGALLDWLGWRAVFYGRIPLSLLALVLALSLLKNEPPEHKHHRFDTPGAVTLFIGVATILIGINRGQGLGWTSPPVVALAVVGIASLALFVRIEGRAVDPVLDLSLLSRRVFAVANGAHLLFYVSTIGLRFSLPFLFIQAMGLPATTSGLLLAFTETMRGILSPFSGRISDRTGTRVLMSSGLGLVVLGSTPMLTWGTGETITSLLPLLAVFGVGMGLFVAPAQSAIMGSVPKPQLGTASGMVATTRQIGSSLGLAIAGTAFVHAKVTAGAAGAQASAAGFHAVVAVSVAFAVAGLLLLVLARGHAGSG